MYAFFETHKSSDYRIFDVDYSDSNRRGETRRDTGARSKKTKTASNQPAGQIERYSCKKGVDIW